MVVVLFVAFISFVFLAVDAQAAGAGVYSTGYKMGELTKFSIKGFVMKSGEGQMLLGNESTPYTKGSGEDKQKVNPWYFSSQDKRIQQELDTNMGEYVVLGYNQARVKFPNVDTEYEITSVEELGPKQTVACVATSYEKGAKTKAGKRVGRIVKASRKGTVIKSWELLVQQGNAGNQFKNLSISEDEELYNCAIKYLKSGQKAKITYTEKYMSIGEDSNYDIIKIEPKGGLE
jgi:hypothetical protein